ncbi:MAG: DUF6291 domain-containing protein [Oscillospiraceae bacterium]|nr:DUF6291 domain-containing protein [Oscillospiraceae bacterium]
MFRESFINYTEWREYSRFLSVEDKAALYDAQFDYHAGETVKPLPKTAEIVFTMMLQQYERNAEKWRQVRRKRSEAGQRGAKARWDAAPPPKPEDTVTNAYTRNRAAIANAEKTA